MRRFISLIIMMSMITPILTGCFDAREIDDNTYVLSIGIDKGASDKWRVTFQFNLMKGAGGNSGEGSTMGGNGSGSGENYGVVTVDAPSFFAAVNILNSTIPRKLNFSHAIYLVFSREVSESGVLKEIMSPLVRFREIRRTMYVIISNKSAKEFIEANKVYIGSLLSKNQEGLVSESDDTGFYPIITLNDLYNSMKSPYRQPLAILGNLNNGENFIESGRTWEMGPKVPINYFAGEIPRQGGNKIELFGCVIADGDRVVGELNGSEVRAMLFTSGNFKRGILTIPDPKVSESVVAINLIQDQKPKVKVSFKDGKPVIHVKITLEGELYAVQSNINYADLKLKPVLEKAFEKALEDGIYSVIDKCKSLKCDIFGFGLVAVRHFSTIQKWEDYNWNKQFQNADVTVEVKFTIRRTGEIINTSPVINSEDKDK